MGVVRQVGGAEDAEADMVASGHNLADRPIIEKQNTMSCRFHYEKVTKSCLYTARATSLNGSIVPPPPVSFSIEVYKREFNIQPHTVTIKHYEYSLKLQDVPETRQLGGRGQSGVGEGHHAGNQLQYWSHDLVH